MSQEQVLEEQTHENWAESDELMEDRLNEEEPWEIAFEDGEQMANDDMVDDWNEEESDE